MSRLEEDKTVWRYQVRNTHHFDKIHVKMVGQGVKVAYGRVAGTERWEIGSYLFDKAYFKSSDQAREWLDVHLKGEIRALIDFKAWNEYRRRLLQAYVEISHVN
jgi:hypothetical protein